MQNKHCDEGLVSGAKHNKTSSYAPSHSGKGKVKVSVLKQRPTKVRDITVLPNCHSSRSRADMLAECRVKPVKNALGKLNGNAKDSHVLREHKSLQSKHNKHEFSLKARHSTSKNNKKRLNSSKCNSSGSKSTRKKLHILKHKEKSIKNFNKTDKLVNRKKVDKTKSRLNKNSGYITCSVCNQTKFYSHVQRRYGIFSCEPCFKFFSRFIKEPKELRCDRKGLPVECLIVAECDNQSEERENKNSSNNCTGSRCKACWLKLCFDKFKINSDIKQTLVDKYYPKVQTEQTTTTPATGVVRTSTSVPATREDHCCEPSLAKICQNSVDGAPPIELQSEDVAPDMTCNNDDATPEKISQAADTKKKDERPGVAAATAAAAAALRSKRCEQPPDTSRQVKQPARAAHQHACNPRSHSGKLPEESKNHRHQSERRANRATRAETEQMKNETNSVSSHQVSSPMLISEQSAARYGSSGGLAGQGASATSAAAVAAAVARPHDAIASSSSHNSPLSAPLSFSAPLVPSIPSIAPYHPTYHPHSFANQPAILTTPKPSALYLPPIPSNYVNSFYPKDSFSLIPQVNKDKTVMDKTIECSTSLCHTKSPTELCSPIAQEQVTKFNSYGILCDNNDKEANGEQPNHNKLYLTTTSSTTKIPEHSMVAVHPQSRNLPLVSPPGDFPVASRHHNNVQSKTINSKKSRCKECEGCRAQDCGNCTYCLDKKKFGGQNVIKQACKFRVCIKFKNLQKYNQTTSPSSIVPDSQSRCSQTPSSSNSLKVPSPGVKMPASNSIPLNPPFFPTPPPHSNPQLPSSPNALSHRDQGHSGPSANSVNSMTQNRLTANFSPSSVPPHQLSSLPTPTNSPLPPGSIGPYQGTIKQEMSRDYNCNYQYAPTYPEHAAARTRGNNFQVNCNPYSNVCNYDPNQQHQSYSRTQASPGYCPQTNGNLKANHSNLAKVNQSSTGHTDMVTQYDSNSNAVTNYAKQSNNAYLHNEYPNQSYQRNNWPQATYHHQFPNLNYEHPQVDSNLYSQHCHFNGPTYNYDHYY